MRRRPSGLGLSRRAVIATGLAASVAGVGRSSVAAAGNRSALRILDTATGQPISRLIYGSNDIGVMDGGLPAWMLDEHAGVTARRLGGDLMTAYNWVNNATNAGKNHRHANGPFLLEALQVPPDLWSEPAILIEAMHGASRALGAKSLVTLPLARHVAADMAGPVAPEEAAPSRRFVEVRWSGRTPANAPVDPAVVDMPQLVARLVERYGSAATDGGIHAYALDNEPGIWFQTHPRLMPQRVTIRAFIDRSIEAARAIKAIDPAARVFGPCSWGATEFVSFQDAPDWPDYQAKGSFLAAYLEAFRRASEHDGTRLLDVLDVHWYPFSAKGNLFRSEDARLDQSRLDAPRALSEAGFVEDSWVPRALRRRGVGTLSLPILPSLQQLIASQFPGTGLAITEFNYGGAGQLTAGLALADALGRFGVGGVYLATHWGSLAGWLGEAYRLYRAPDEAGRVFGHMALPVEMRGTADLTAYAAGDALGMQLVLINRGIAEQALDIGFAGKGERAAGSVSGFDAAHPRTGPVDERPMQVEGGWRVVIPPRSARRYAFS